MRAIFLISLLAFANGEDSPSALGEAQGLEVGGYHMKFGVPAAKRLKVKEDVSVRIANGFGAALGDHPFMAGLLITLTTKEQSMCGGSLVTANRVVTAATCKFDGYSTALDFLVVLGSVFINGGGKRLYANTVITHPDFNPYTVANDIAILIIPKVAFTSNIQPIRLPFGPYLTNNFAGKWVETVGYGALFNGHDIKSNKTSTLRYRYALVMNNYECQDYYGYLTVTNGVICTKGVGGPCEGDMGGPLVLRKYNDNHHMLIGVASFGSSEGCKSANHPTGYTRVTAYTSWIRSLL